MSIKTYGTIVPDGDFPVGDPAKTYAGKVVNQNGGNYVRFWFGTQSEYDALSSVEDDVCYHIIEK